MQSRFDTVAAMVAKAEGSPDYTERKFYGSFFERKPRWQR
jgi:hypothetical protein